MSARYYGEHPDFAGEVDHEQLLARLVDEFPDGWALSTSSKTLAAVLALCPAGVRIGAWAFPTPPHQGTRRARTAWEPVIFYGGRLRPPGAPTLVDWIYAPPLRWKRYPGGVVGMKPPKFSWWVFDCLGAQAGDELADLFPGSGAVTRAWERYVATPPGEVSAGVDRRRRAVAFAGESDASGVAGARRVLADAGDGSNAVEASRVDREGASRGVDGRQLDVFEVLEASCSSDERRVA